MPDASGPSVRGLYRYPIKGLSPEPLDRMPLVAGGTAPFDRAYAIENGPGRFDPEHPAHLPKINFLMLMRNERLATLATHFDDATQTLAVFRAGKQVARGDLTTPLGRKMIEQFFAALPPSTPFAVADIPLLFETGRQGEFDQVIVVACRPDTQIARVMARDKLPREEAELRLRAQAPIDDKVRRADHVIRTDGSHAETDAQVAAMVVRLRAAAGGV